MLCLDKQQAQYTSTNRIWTQNVSTKLKICDTKMQTPVVFVVSKTRMSDLSHLIYKLWSEPRKTELMRKLIVVEQNLRSTSDFVNLLQILWLKVASDMPAHKKKPTTRLLAASVEEKKEL